METVQNDVKATTEPSPVEVAPATSTETKVATQSNQGVKEPETMAEVAAEVAKAHGIGEDKPKSTEEGEKKTEVVETAKVEGEQGEKKEELPPDVEKSETPGPVPYDRFVEVNEKAKNYETQVKELEPVAKTHQQIVSYCRTHGITQAQFSEGLALMSLMNSDPAKAVAQLTKTIEELQGFVGDRLPEDLQKKVDTGKLDIEDAKEMAALRAKTKFVEGRTKLTQQQQAQNEQDKFLREASDAASSWEQTRAKTDPDMREGTEKYQLVLDKFRALSDEKDNKGQFVHPINTVQEYVKLLDTAYAFVDSYTKKLTKGNGTAARKVLTSTASSVTAEVEPKNMQDIARQVGAKYGISI